MSAGYSHERPQQRDRRIVLGVIRDQLGDEGCADFMIDALVGFGRGFKIEELPSLISVRLSKKALERRRVA
jgi:hypothetical protein